MKSHWQYIRYLIRHKWFVLVAGLKVRAPLWRLIIHDWSKFLPSEWFAYVDYFYREEETISDDQFVDERFNMAWLYHQNRNKHHWQYWVMQKEDGGLAVLPMPEKYVREMVADWASAGRAINGHWDVAQWYRKNRDRIKIHSETRMEVEQLLQVYYGYRINVENKVA